MLDINLSSTITSEPITLLIVQDLTFCELQSVVEIRCILRETQNAISNDSANIALESVEAADKKLATAFGSYTNNSGSDSTASLN